MWQQNYGLSVSQNKPEAYDVYIDTYLYTCNGMSVLKKQKKNQTVLLLHQRFG
jgi:hypothetical protein